MNWINRKTPRTGRHQLIVDQATNETVCVYHGVECLNKKNKFNAKKAEYNGILYDSQKEAHRAAEIDLLARSGAIRGWRRQVCVRFDICTRCLRLCSSVCRFHKQERLYHLSSYYVDFVIEENDGTETYEEVKSSATKTSDWRKKWRLLEILYGDDETKHLVVNE